MSKNVTIGILNIQGDVEENQIACEMAIKDLGISGNVVLVKHISDLNNIDGLIIPGGESTVISTLLFLQQQGEKIKQRIINGLPTLGTCAGLILLADKVYDKTLGLTKQETLHSLDVTVERNAFGRQKESFEADLNVSILDEKPFKSIFIRGPIIKEAGKDVQTIATLGDKVVAVKQNNIIATSFHPELTNDYRLHKYFIKMIYENKNTK